MWFNIANVVKSVRSLYGGCETVLSESFVVWECSIVPMMAYPVQVTIRPHFSPSCSVLCVW
jgi:hypothetical protein